MGKLHTLRRAVKREPDRWINRQWGNDVMSAMKNENGNWVPFYAWWRERNSYRNFVRCVLKELGYDVDQGR